VASPHHEGILVLRTGFGLLDILIAGETPALQQSSRAELLYRTRLRIAFFKRLFLRARIRNDKCGNCQNAANDQHQENRPAQKTASRLDRRLYYLFSIVMH
jgi:hypothetical protein